jgi:hypothetical protein
MVSEAIAAHPGIVIAARPELRSDDHTGGLGVGPRRWGSTLERVIRCPQPGNCPPERNGSSAAV